MPFESTLTSSTSPIILDGALATYLEHLGATLDSALWSASILSTNPSLITRTHLDYYRAGADVAITASYQASVPGLIKHLELSEENAREVVKRSVECARRARDEVSKELEGEREKGGRRLWVAGSVGPYGAFLADGSEYRGDYSVSEREIKDFHRGRVEALGEAGVDVLALETMPSFAEIRALVGLLETEFPDARAWVSVTLKDEKRISDGTSVEEVATFLDSSEQIIAMGVNCVPQKDALAALEEFGKFTSKPLVVYPNSGEVWDAEGRKWVGERAEGEYLRDRARMWWKAGARLIGGCCRTTPGDIGTIREALKGETEMT